MKAFLISCSLFISAGCFSQEELQKQLQFLIDDSKTFFEKSIGIIDCISGKDTTYTTITSLYGKASGSISFRNGKTKWANYSIFLLEDVSLKKVREAALFWRSTIRSVAVSYIEEVNEGKRKNIHGKPEYEYLFTKIESGRKSWINVLYAKDKKNYYLYLSIGWQDWIN